MSTAPSKKNLQSYGEEKSGLEGARPVVRTKTEMALQATDKKETHPEEEKGSEEDVFEEEFFELEEEQPPLKVKKCKKKKKKDIVQKEQKGKGDEVVGDDEYEVEDEWEEGWGEGEQIEETKEGDELGGEEKEDEVLEGTVENYDEGGEEKKDSEEYSDEYTTCSGSEDVEEQGPRWDDLQEDELGFLLLKDPGIYEALKLKEEEKDFSADGTDAYLELCKAFGIAPIKSFLKQLFTETVDLKFYGVNAKNIRSLAQALKYNPYVKTLDLTEAQMDEAAVYEIAELIRENNTLTSIILRKCKIGPEGAKYLGDTLDLSVTLEDLDLSANGLGDDGVEIMSPAIGRNTALKSLNLSSNQIGQKGAKALGTALKENETLAELILRWNNLYEDAEKGLRVLLSALSRPEIPVEKLDLSWNALGASTAPFVRSFMVKAPLLREISIDHNRFPDEGALTMKRGLAKAAQLEIFRMGFNPMTSEAAYALLGAVQPELKVLDLDGICVKKNFLTLKQKKLKDRDIEIIHGEALSAYVIPAVDMGKIMLLRARFEGLKPKKIQKKKDFGHLLLELDLEQIKTLPPDEFKRRLKAKKIKIRDELVRGLLDLYKTKRGFVTVEPMLEKYLELFPDTELPPPKPKMENKKKKKGKKEKK